MTTLDNDDAPLTLTMNNDQGQTHPEETTLVEQTNNSWHIDSSTELLIMTLTVCNRDNNIDNDDWIDLNWDWKDNFTVAWSLVYLH